MPISNNILAGSGQGAAADLGEPIDQSLRFRNNSGQTATFLYSTGLAGTSLTDYTISVWIKRSFPDTSARYILTSGDYTTGTGGGNNVNKLSFNNDGATPGFVFAEGGGNTHSSTQPLQRDFSAWYHVVAVQDSTANTQKLYVNGTEIGSASGSGTPGLFNQSGDNAVLIGLYADPDYAGTGWNGYMAEFNFLETALSPTDFGRTNKDGVWVPENLSGLTSAQYGAAGFRLKFDSSAGLGDDSAPIGTGHSSANDFTASGFDTAAISSSNLDNDIDQSDTPTSIPVVTFNPVDTSSSTVVDGGLLSYSNSSTWHKARSTQPYPSTGTWYYECDCVATPAWIGCVQGNKVLDNSSPAGPTGYWILISDNTRNFNGSYTAGGGGLSPGDTLGVTYNADTDTMKWYTNNTLVLTATSVTPDTQSNLLFPLPIFYSAGASTVNFGQYPFKYTPPDSASGCHEFLTNTEPTIKNGKDHFNILTWTGTGATNARTGLGFQPDLVWIKKRGNTTESHDLQDVIRGPGERFRTDSSDGTRTISSSITSFDSDGFTVVDSGTTNELGKTYVAWCWKAGGTAGLNEAGSIDSQVSVNTDAGFSIVSYTGDQNPGATVGHGLTTAPEVIFVKSRSFDQTWHVKHSGVGNNTDSLNLDTNAGGINYNAWNNTAPGNSVFTLGPIDGTNKDTQTFIAYCWHSVEGYSKFGSYTGGGSGSAPNYDGPFIYLGFRPSWLLIKRSNAGGDPWILLDSTRDTDNFAFRALQPDNNSLEVSSGDQYAIDFLSNGFKCRSNNAAINTSGATYVYMAFAENPFGGENVPPVTAR